MFDSADLGLPHVAVLMTLHRSDSIEYFETALRSVETQHGTGGIHIYLGCDGPLSAEQTIWLELNRHRFYIVRHNTSCIGLARSLNLLIDLLGEEEFVFRMDADDISLPNRFATQIAYLRAHPDVGLVGCQVQDIDEAGNVSGQRSYPLIPSEARASLTRLIPLLHPTFCFRRALLKDQRLRYPDAYLTEDLAFLVRLSELGVEMANVPQTLFSWRVGAGFFKRRTSLRRGLQECKWYTRAVFNQQGMLSLSYIYPLLRLFMRLLPSGVLRVLYQSGLRASVAKSVGKRSEVDDQSCGANTVHFDPVHSHPSVLCLAKTGISREL